MLSNGYLGACIKAGLQSALGNGSGRVNLVNKQAEKALPALSDATLLDEEESSTTSCHSRPLNDQEEDALLENGMLPFIDL